MKNYWWLALAVVACTGGPTADNAERPSDWRGSFTVQQWQRQANIDGEQVNLMVARPSVALEPLVNQLFELAISGDAAVFAAGPDGDADLNHPLPPEALIELIERVDTIFTENLETGAFEPTVVADGISASSAEVLTLWFGWQEQGDTLQLMPTRVALGKKVYDPVDGTLRGVKQWFFIELDAPNFKDEHRLTCLSDSTGLIVPESINRWGAGPSFYETVESLYGQPPFTLGLGLRSTEQKMWMRMNEGEKES